MKHQHYIKRLRLFKLPYKLLLAYHAPFGTTKKGGYSYRMLAYILVQRNNTQILNMSFTMIHLRKALAAIFAIMRCRASFMIYLKEYVNGVGFDNLRTHYYVRKWVPGLLSNHRLVLKDIQFQRNTSTFHSLLKTAQLRRLKNTTFRTGFKTLEVYASQRKRKLPRMPGAALALDFDAVFCDECLRKRIPSIVLCDSAAAIDMIRYPIVSNQRSVHMTYLIIGIFIEACAMGLVNRHLTFSRYYNKDSKMNLTKHHFALFKKKYK